MKRFLKNKTYVMGSVLCICLILFIGLSQFWSAESLNDGTTIYQGIFINDIDVGGKTKAEAEDILKSNLKDPQKPINININCDGNILNLTQQDFTFEYNIKGAVDEAYFMLREKNKIEKYIDTIKMKLNAVKIYTEITVTKDSIDNIVNKIVSMFNLNVKNTHVENFDPKPNPIFTYRENSEYFTVDKEELKKKIEEIVFGPLNTGDIIIERKKVEEKFPIEEAKKETVLLGEFSTVSTNTEAATHNMRLALGAVNGKILNPGDVFSFNELVGKASKDQGYLPASVISNGRYITGYGGGICQAATTIYGAAIRANIEIVERYNHRWPSKYVPHGLDSTIYYGHCDLKLKNNSEFPMYIVTYTENKTLFCKIYGKQSSDYDYIDVNSWVTARTNGKIYVMSERIYYKNSAEISRDKLPSSSYVEH